MGHEVLVNLRKREGTKALAKRSNIFSGKLVLELLSQLWGLGT